jgi:phosphopantetheinyl transferase (holo-ACP synthase)
MQQRLDFIESMKKRKGYRSLEARKGGGLRETTSCAVCVTTYEKEKDEIWAMFEEDKAKIQKEKDQLLAEQTAVKEAVTKALRSVSGLAQEEEESVEIQVGKLVEAIQQLQARVMELELQAVSSTPQEVCDQREEAAKSAVGRIRTLALECKKVE